MIISISAIYGEIKTKITKIMSLFKKIYLSNILLMLPLLMFGQLPKFQAAYIYNFSNYIEWPVNYKTGDFVIGRICNIIWANLREKNNKRSR